MVYFLIFLLIIWFCWPWLSRAVSRWVSGYMSRRAEDMMRRMMGMPSRKEEKRRAQAKPRQNRQSSSSRDDSRRGSRTERHYSRGGRRPNVVQMMKDVAVDVEFSEVKEFSSSTIITEDDDQTRIITEEQVSDAEYVEISNRKSSK